MGVAHTADTVVGIALMEIVAVAVDTVLAIAEAVVAPQMVLACWFSF